MKIKSVAVLALALAGTWTLQGCTTPGLGGSDYTYGQVRGEQSVRIGTIESIRKVKIQSSDPGTLGAIGGAVAGAALGHTVGQGNGEAAATILGALAGGAAGEAAQSSASTKEGVELTIRLDNGYVIAVTQGADEEFRVGDRVQVLGGGGATRVTRLDPASNLNYARPAGPSQAPAPMPPRNAPPPAPSSAPSAAPSGSQDLLYYCPDSNAYYPAVSSCKSPWMRVVK
ncbi:MAG: glycine zipper 2TM domain-containing protein [Betaproteobacteria bacterium]|nr:glycine zipper 2TM domain-containing protein [Betaproteobacteria bacterium]